MARLAHTTLFFFNLLRVEEVRGGSFLCHASRGTAEVRNNTSPALFLFFRSCAPRRRDSSRVSA